MDRQRIADALAVLRTELADASQLSDEARDALRRVTDDVERLLEKQPDPDGGPAPTASGLQQALQEFEAEHPQLTGALNQVATALANLGI
jgi:hypothetical protein